MRALALALLLTGCAGNWKDFNYGPGDWLAEHGVNVDSPYTYERLRDPEIIYLVSDDIGRDCGELVLGCAYAGDPCVIYLPERASPNTVAHEERHCRGWTHADMPGAKWGRVYGL